MEIYCGLLTNLPHNLFESNTSNQPLSKLLDITIFYFRDQTKGISLWLKKKSTLSLFEIMRKYYALLFLFFPGLIWSGINPYRLGVWIGENCSYYIEFNCFDSKL